MNRQLFISIATAVTVLGSAAQAESIKVGGLFGTTGPQANFGVPYSQGLELAVDQINDAGGIKIGDTSYTVELTLADTKSDPSQAVAEAQRMLADGVKVIFCCNISAEAVPVLQAALPRGVIMISPNAAATQFLGTEGRDLLFKIGNIEVGERGSTAMWVPFVLEKFETKTAAIMTPSDEAGQIYADSYRETLEAKGVDVVAVERYDHGAADFTPQLTSIRQKDPDLLLAGYSDEVRGIFRQALELGMEAKFAGTVGVSGAAGQELSEFAYPSWTRYLGPEQTDPKVLTYMENLKKLTGELTPFSFWSISQYDWMNMLADAMEKAGTVDDLKAVGAKMRSQTYSGMVDWEVDDKGLGRQSMEGVYLKDGKVAEIRPIPLPAAK